MIASCAMSSCTGTCWVFSRRGGWLGWSCPWRQARSTCGPTIQGGTRFCCPECDRELATYDHAEERTWRHLDSCQFLTFLHARPPRVDCPDHGVRQARLPWAEPMSRLATLFERMAVDVLAQCDVLGASRVLRTSWDQTWHLMERAVARGQGAKTLSVPARLGVDEKSAGRGLTTSPW